MIGHRVGEVTGALDSVNAPSVLVRVLLVVAIVVAAVSLSYALRGGLRVVLRRAVRRTIAGRSGWTARLPRTDDGGRDDQRRVQRADATAHMLGRVSSLAVFGIATFSVSHVLTIDPVVLLSSAGFIGLGLAIGGQTVIKDWLVGLLVLLDDRYAVGDLTTMTVAGKETTGTVEVLNGAGVRLRLADGTTWHAGHGSIDSVVNSSQMLVPNRIELPPDVGAQLDGALLGSALDDASHDLGLTDVVLLPDTDPEHAGESRSVVTVLASRKLSRQQRQIVAERIAAVGTVHDR